MLELDRNLAEIAARIAGESAEMDAIAERVADQIRADARADQDTGAFADSIKVERDKHSSGVTDRVVYSDHRAAFAIEFGHSSRDGETYVPGKFYFSNKVRGS